MLLLALATISNVNASQEGALVLGSFKVESPGIGSSGPVIVSGTQGKGITSLRVEAFGKQFDLTPDQLKSLQRVSANGLQLSYEGGYEELGGRTIYLIFTTGFTRQVIQRTFVIITESGSVKVGPEP
jgi:hypothetical protein